MMNNILYFILLLSLITILIPPISLHHNRTVEESQARMNCLRGVLAVIIIIGHCTMEITSIPKWFFPLTKLNTICVGFFLALSGYGLYYSWECKAGYLKPGFLKKKMMALWIPGLTAVLFGCVLSLIELPMGIPFRVSKPNWYIYVQAGLYIVFYLVFKHVKNKDKAFFLITGIVIGFTVVMFALHAPRIYFISEWGFPFGMMLAKYRAQINHLLKTKRPLVVMVILLITGAGAYAFASKDYSIYDLVCHNLLIIGAYALVSYMLHFVNLRTNKFCKWLTGMSFELYLFQFPLLVFYLNLFNRLNLEVSAIYIYLVLFSDIAVSIIFRLIYTKIRG